MKMSFWKGTLVGFALALTATFGVAAIAESIGVDLNLVKIMKGNEAFADKDETYVLHNGDVVPHSILYKGTTYLPIRRISDIMDNGIFWNGDTGTVTLIQGQFNTEMKVLTRQPDCNGNSWHYGIRGTTEGEYFLVVNDSVRDFTRVYQLASEDAYSLKNDKIVFVTPNLQVRVIHFGWGADVQDGLVMGEIPGEEYSLQVLSMQGDKVCFVQDIQAGFVLGTYDAATDKTETLALHSGGAMGSAQIFGISIKDEYIYYTAEDHWGNTENYRVKIDGSEQVEKV